MTKLELESLLQALPECRVAVIGGFSLDIGADLIVPDYSQLESIFAWLGMARGCKRGHNAG